MRPRLLLHLLALALLAVGLVVPWVALDPQPKRAESLMHFEAFASGENLPGFVRELLAERGFSPGLSPDQLWSVLGRDDHAELFAFVAAREQLYSWDFLRLPTTLSVKAVVVAGYAALLVCVALLWVGRPAAPETADEPTTSAPPQFRQWLSGGCVVAALLVIVTAPLLDSFGFADKWGLAWLDILSGARVTLAPRALLPLGLLLLAVALALAAALEGGAADEDVA